VSEAMTGLQPGQTIFYRVSARVAALQPRTAVGETLSFTTPAPAAPGVVTGIASAITLTSAVLNGSVDPNRRDTTWHFVYGPTTAYGSSTDSVSAGSVDGAASVAASVTGLEPGTLFHYRVEATNALGTTVGEDQTFTTQAAAVVVVPLTLSGLAVTPQRFRLGSALPKIAANGTRIRFTLSAPARVRLQFFRKQPGRRVGKACKRPTRANRKNKRCTRLVKKGTLSFDAVAGARTVRFSGRLTKKRSLPPGRYKLVARATDATGKSTAPASARFRLLRRR